MASTFILTSSPLLLSQVTLASFIPDVSQPHQDAKRPYTVSSSDYSVQPDENFDGLVNTSSKSLLDFLLSKFAGIFGGLEKGDSFKVTAGKGNIYSLNSPRDMFASIIASEKHGDQIKLWLEECKLNKQSPRFVVGYRTFIDAELSRSEHVSHHFGGKLNAPTSAAFGDPTGLADVSGQASRKVSKEVKGDACTPGERIYAISYRKIAVSYREGKINATLALKSKWEPFIGARGSLEGSENIHLQADMSGEDDDEDCDTFLIGSRGNGTAGTMRIAILRDEDVDSEESEGDDEMNS
ncbi:uncharacterized protein BDW70DRAFT_163957 [Aspergillus foveolatus]|uniref:uncharacterized protein n=1 Tax=Aspergillus foveolatus TaxID=210207 RepID=UPI003CCCA531